MEKSGVTHSPSNKEHPHQKGARTKFRILPWNGSGYTCNRDRAISDGSLGVFYYGKHSRGEDVIVWVYEKTECSLSELNNFLRAKMILIRKQHPGTIHVLGVFNMSEERTSFSIVIALRVINVENKEEFLDQLQKEDKEGFFENTEQQQEHESESRNLKSHDTPKDSSSIDKADRATHDSVEITPNANIHVVSSSNPEGRRIGEYFCFTGKILGSGRFGHVYLGKHIKENYLVAIKITKGPLYMKDRLLTETRILERLCHLKHPNVLRLFGTYRNVRGDEIELAHVLELCSDGDLRSFLKRHRPLSELQARRLMRQLVYCLCVLKTRGVMHRDLKPANILLTSSNIDEAIVKVADWGIAKSCSAKHSHTAPEEGVDGILFQSAVGTAAYMSPERLAREFYDFQAEVWAAGVILYELLFASHPYLHPSSDVRTPEELLETIKRAEELQMTGRKRGETEESEEIQLSHCCYELMRGMLDVDAKKRYTIEQVRDHPWFHPSDNAKPEERRETEELKSTQTDFTLGLADGSSLCELPDKPSEVPTQSTEQVNAAEASVTVQQVEKSPVMEASIVSSPIRHDEPRDAQVHVSTDAQQVNKPTDAQQTNESTDAQQVSERTESQQISEAVNLTIETETSHVIESLSLPVPKSPRLDDPLLCEESTSQLRSRSRSVLHRSQLLYQALRSYLHILRYDVVEEESDPGRQLVLLSYTWSIFRAGVQAAQLEEYNTEDRTNPHPTDPANVLQRLPDDLRETEAYIQEAAQRLRRRIPAAAIPRRPLAAAMCFSTASVDSEGVGAEAATSPKKSPLAFPTAQTLLFQRALSLVRMAATEELMLGRDDAPESFLEEDEAQPLAGHSRRREMYEKAMSILRVLLQQAVMRVQMFPHLSSSAEEEGKVQVHNVSLVPLEDEADQRTVQALLYHVEKYYRRSTRVK